MKKSEIKVKLIGNNKYKYTIEFTKPHPLHNNYKDYMECHIQPDWLLVWKQDDDVLTLLLTNTGTHSYIFGW